MKKWEYKYKTDVYGMELNELGEEGWELVTVYYDIVLKEYEFIFKREIEQK